MYIVYVILKILYSLCVILFYFTFATNLNLKLRNKGKIKNGIWKVLKNYDLLRYKS